MGKKILELRQQHAIIVLLTIPGSQIPKDTHLKNRWFHQQLRKPIGTGLTVQNPCVLLVSGKIYKKYENKKQVLACYLISSLPIGVGPRSCWAMIESIIPASSFCELWRVPLSFWSDLRAARWASPATSSFPVNRSIIDLDTVEPRFTYTSVYVLSLYVLFFFYVLLKIRTRIWYTYIVLRTRVQYTYFDYVKQSTYIKFEYVKWSTYSKFEYLKWSTYIEFEYVFRVLFSFQFCNFSLPFLLSKECWWVAVNMLKL